MPCPWTTGLTWVHLPSRPAQQILLMAASHARAPRARLGTATSARGRALQLCVCVCVRERETDRQTDSARLYASTYYTASFYPLRIRCPVVRAADLKSRLPLLKILEPSKVVSVCTRSVSDCIGVCIQLVRACLSVETSAGILCAFPVSSPNFPPSPFPFVLT